MKSLISVIFSSDKYFMSYITQRRYQNLRVLTR